MQEEITKIIYMVEEGKITSSEASELINALQEEQSIKNLNQSYLKKKIKIRIDSNQQEIVNVNIPVRFVKWLLKTGHGIASSVPEAKPYMENIDMNALTHAIDYEIEGKIIDIETQEGESIAVYIE